MTLTRKDINDLADKFAMLIEEYRGRGLEFYKCLGILEVTKLAAYPVLTDEKTRVDG